MPSSTKTSPLSLHDALPISNALLLFLIIFAWTPPHFWALAIARRDEYARAGIPMLPVTHGLAYTRLQVLLYTVLLVLVTLMPFRSEEHRLNSSHEWISYAVFHQDIPSFPTRRSSDLECAAAVSHHLRVDAAALLGAGDRAPR